MEEKSRNDLIHEKGFNMYGSNQSEYKYNKIKIGSKSLEDAILDLSGLAESLKRNQRPLLFDKNMVLKAIIENDVKKLREISNYFYKIDGIYSKLCNYFAYMYRYDWYVYAEGLEKDAKEEKVLKDFNKILNYLDNTYIKKICGDIALEVIKSGAYYGYITPSANSLILQQLPIDYCRSRYYIGPNPAVEFNMKYFDTFANIEYRLKVLKLFPEEFQKGYILYKQGKLPPDTPGNLNSGWYLLDPKNTVKFNCYNSEIPIFVNIIPSIMDLLAAQGVDRKKQMQQLLKIIVQKLPLDKNGDLIFDVEEARDIHTNAVEMLSRAIGVDVLTTFADVDSIAVSDKNTTTTTDDLERVERQVYNNAGTSKNLFNTSGNMALSYSILEDEASFRNLLLQFNIFFDRVVQAISFNNKKYSFRFSMLETTQYNYKEVSKQYKEMVQIGYSKMLPLIALGHSQSFFLNSLKFENEVLKLSEIMIPPLMSSTLNGEDILGNSNKTNKNNSQDNMNNKSSNSKQVIKTEEKKTGRPEKADTEKSDKTIQNKEAMG